MNYAPALIAFVISSQAASSAAASARQTAATTATTYPSGCSWAEGAPFCAELGKACIDDLALEFNFKKFPYQLGCYDFCSQQHTCADGRHCVDVEARLNPLKNKTPKRYSVCVVDGAGSPSHNPPKPPR